MASQKPVIVIVPCAGQTAVYYRKLITPLRKQGFTVLTPALLTEGLDDSIIGKTWNDDARHIQEMLRPYLDAGREAVVVGHSGGAIPVCFATKGLTASERGSQGLKGGIKAAVFLGIWSKAEFSGKTMYEVLGGRLPSATIEGERLVPDAAHTVKFYSDLDPEAAEAATRGLVDMSKRAWETPVMTSQEVAVAKTYVQFTQDQVVPEWARSAAEAAKVMGEGRFVEVEGGHMAFMRDGPAEQVVQVIVEASGCA